MLDALGIDGEQTAVYRVMLSAPSLTVTEIAAASGLDRAAAAIAVAELERRGLVARPAADVDRFVASPPAVALRPLLHDRERALTRAHETLTELSELYRLSAEQRGPADVVDVVRGADAVRRRILQLQASAAREVRVLVLSEIALLTSDENVEEDRALARGIRYRVIVESKVLERPGFLDAAREAAQAGEEIRVYPSLPTRMVIADDSLALLPMRALGGVVSGALLIHPSGLLDLVSAIFEEYWKSANDLLATPSDDDGSGGPERDLLRLLLLGLTDAAVGAQLGISERTVQRRVAESMANAGVTTRLQLGAEAVRRGWV